MHTVLKWLHDIQYTHFRVLDFMTVDQLKTLVYGFAMEEGYLQKCPTISGFENCEKIFKKLIRFLEGSWNHKYFGSRTK